MGWHRQSMLKVLKLVSSNRTLSNYQYVKFLFRKFHILENGVSLETHYFINSDLTINFSARFALKLKTQLDSIINDTSIGWLYV